MLAFLPAYNAHQKPPLASRASLPWVKLVDDALEPDNGEKSRAESRQAGQEKNAEREQRLPACRLCQSARQASFPPSSTRGTGSAVAVQRASGIVERFVPAVAGCVLLRHFCVRGRPNWLVRPFCHFPVSPCAPHSPKLPFVATLYTNHLLRLLRIYACFNWALPLQ